MVAEEAKQEPVEITNINEAEEKVGLETEIADKTAKAEEPQTDESHLEDHGEEKQEAST